MTNRVKKYLLFMFGNWSTYQNNAKVVNNIREIMETIVIEEEFSFVTGDNIVIMCIKSRMEFNDIEEVFQDYLTPHVGAFFLMPKPRKLSYRLDKNLEEHLFGERKNTKQKTIDPKLAKELSKSLKSLVDNKIKEIKRVIKNPINVKDKELKFKKSFTVDVLLDKIIDEGIDNLTKEELEFLDKYNN